MLASSASSPHPNPSLEDASSPVAARNVKLMPPFMRSSPESATRSKSTVKFARPEASVDRVVAARTPREVAAIATTDRLDHTVPFAKNWNGRVCWPAHGTVVRSSSAIASKRVATGESGWNVGRM
jgi:hypothetical protein